MTTMTGVPYPEVQEVGGRSRPWSIGSQLLGHYETDRSQANGQLPTTGNQRSYSPSSTVFEVSDETTQSNLHPGPNQIECSQASIQSSIGNGREGPTQDQRPLLRARTTFYDRTVTDWWWWELFSWLVSFSCVATIVGVLAFYDGKRQPEYIVRGITLNAFVAVFSAVAKAALILPVSEGIGQLKWIWFQNEEKLWDFFTFDGASRGPWGAAMLLAATKGRHLVSLGAIITILALAFEPFFQQIVSFQVRETANGVSTITIASTYKLGGDGQYSRRSDYNDVGNQGPTSMVLALNDISTLRNATSQPPPFVCPTGHCNWTAYSSLGVCHRCEDLSTLPQYICTDKTEKLRGTPGVKVCGFQLNNTFLVGSYEKSSGRTGSQNLSVLVVGDTYPKGNFGKAWNSTVFTDVPNAILDFYVAYIPKEDFQPQRNTTLTLLECFVHWCVRSYKASYDNGILQEQLVSTYAQLPTIEGYRGQNNSINNINLANGSPPFNMTFDGKTFEVPENGTESLGWAILSILPIKMTSEDGDSTGQFLGGWNFVQTAPYDIRPFLDNLTKAMTDNIRSRVDGTQMIKGLAWSTQTFVDIRWVWIILPSALLLTTLGFVGVTAFKSHIKQTPAWKSSALATLLHGLTEESRNRLDPKASPSEIEVVSRSLKVRLSLENGTTRLIAV